MSSNEQPNQSDKHRRHTIAVLPSINAVIYPGRTIPLNIGRKKSLSALEHALKTNHLIIIAAQKPRQDDGQDRKHVEDPTIESLYRTATLCKVERTKGSSQQGSMQAIVTGLQRVEITEFFDGSHLEANYAVLDDINDLDAKSSEIFRENIKKLAKDILELVPTDTSSLESLVDSVTDLRTLMHLVAENIEGTIEQRQNLLETLSLKSRALLVLEQMNTQKEHLDLHARVQQKMSERIGKHQKEHILREQMRAIKDELGEGDEEKSDKLLERVEASDMPKDVKKVARDEAKRLEQMGGSSPEAHVIRNYVEYLLTLPWVSTAQTNIDLDKSKSILNAEHFGMDRVKKRILQHLAVMKLKPDNRGSIVLLVGPPGVGKTSLGQSIAAALDRPFVRVSLGGVRDDADIRGHRRTYVGAMAGRIIQGIKRSGSKNPVMLLDEIDKLGRGYGGDPAAAMLEVLDPEQNAKFTDHYLDVPYDLSDVVFIGTANSLETIPAPLLDRMEIIELGGYTTSEKLHIAKNHLFPKQLEKHGIKNEQLCITDDAILRIINFYTREAGVRELQRMAAAVCRGMTERIVQAPSGTILTVDLIDLEELLGPERFIHEVAERIAPPGVVTGMAWTPRGGDILFVEAGLMPGNGNMMLTGQLGDVMKESAHIALSLVRANLSQIVPGFSYDKKDIHIHVPAGSIPKDGPSAGVTMLTTIASLFSGRPVSPKLSMTGEISLRGAVLPVGGIKEKVIAAHRAGIEHVLLPRRNEKDLKDVPEEVRSQLRFSFADHVGDVLRVALGTTPVLPFGNANALSVSSDTIIDHEAGDHSKPSCQHCGHSGRTERVDLK